MKTATMQAGMGVGIGDFNLDGNLDILNTHFADDTSTLYLNNGKGNFRDVDRLRSGLGVETRFVSWGCGMVDLDNDGYPDLFVVDRQHVSRDGARHFPIPVPHAARASFAISGNGVSKN